MAPFVESVGPGYGPVIVATNRVNGIVSSGFPVVLQFSEGFDASFMVGVNVNCTAFTSGSLSLQCQYTNEANVAQSPTIQGHFSSGYGTSISGTGSFEGQVIHIRAKGATSITIAAISAAFVGTYSVEAYLLRIG